MVSMLRREHQGNINEHTIQLLDVVVRLADSRVGQTLLRGNESGLQHGHHAVHETVNDLETTALAVIGGSVVTLVATLALQRQVLEGDIADLEDLHRHTVGLVLTDRLQQTGEQAGADNLELLSLGVGQLHGGVAIILAVQPGEVLIMRAQDQRQDLGPTGHGSFHTNNVGELVDGQRLGNSARLARERAGKVVEAVSDGNVLHDITLVQNIGAGRRDLDINDVGLASRGLGMVSHLAQVLADLIGSEVQTTALVDVGNLRLGDTGRKVGGDTSLSVVL